MFSKLGAALLALLTFQPWAPKPHLTRVHRPRLTRVHVPHLTRVHLPHLTRVHLPLLIRLPRDYGAWSRVAHCESGGWTVLGGAYPDSLGISAGNYERFGGVPLPPGPVAPATRILQIRVADRLLASYRAAIPDQYGCSAW